MIFGSLAGRSPYNLAPLDRLLGIEGPVKFFDVNLRPPFADPRLVLDLAKRADVIKLNDDEVGQLASWVRTGEMTLDTPHGDDALRNACAALADAAGVSRICVTRAARGAALWDRGDLTRGVETRGVETRTVLERACRLGAYVASHHGATPLLPPEILREFKSA